MRVRLLDDLIDAMLDRGIDTIVGVGFITAAIVNLVSGLKNYFYGKTPEAKSAGMTDLILSPILLITGLVDLSHNDGLQIVFTLLVLLVSVSKVIVYKQPMISKSLERVATEEPAASLR